MPDPQFTASCSLVKRAREPPICAAVSAWPMHFSSRAEQSDLSVLLLVPADVRI